MDTINSIAGKVDRIICIDGKYPDFIWDGEISTDGTIEYLKEVGVELYIFPQDEVSKRNKYLTIAEGDILVIDADEVLVGGIPKLTQDIGQIKILNIHPRQKFGIYHRFFKWHKGLRYKNNHHQILDSKGNLYCESDKAGYPHQHVKDFYIEHRGYKRTPQRQQAKEDYYNILRTKEVNKSS